MAKRKPITVTKAQIRKLGTALNRVRAKFRAFEAAYAMLRSLSITEDGEIQVSEKKAALRVLDRIDSATLAFNDAIENYSDEINEINVLPFGEESPYS